MVQNMYFHSKDKLFFPILFLAIILHFIVLTYSLFNQVAQSELNDEKSIISLKKVVLTPQNKVINKTDKPPLPVASQIPVDYILEEIRYKEDDFIYIPDIYDLSITETSSEDFYETYSTVNIKAIKDEYIRILNESVLLNKVYPRQAKRFNQEGIVEISFTILKDGTITQVSLYTSSTFSSIDNSALKAVSDLKKIKPIPTELGIDSWDIILPIIYELH